MLTRRQLTATVLAASALLATAVPVGAADVIVDFTVSASAGGLSVSTASGTDVLAGATTSLLSTASISDTLPAVTVTDNRGALGGGAWTVGVGSTSFVNQSDNGITIPASAGRVYVNTANIVTGTLAGVLGGMVVVAGESAVPVNDLGTPYTLLSGTTLPLLTGSVTITPTMDVTVPQNAAVGTYRGTVTYTTS